jgi:outer membrane protein TolC
MVQGADVDSLQTTAERCERAKEEIPVKNKQMRSQRIMKNLSVVLLQTVWVIAMASFFLGGAVTAVAEVLNLEAAVQAAQDNDPWLVENRHGQSALEARSIAAGSLPDPTVSLGLLNFPVDTFDIDQEPMTQIKVEVSQAIPRGDSLKLKREQLQTASREYPQQRRDRRARTVVTVGRLWLDAYKVQESITLIENDRPLFEQLVDVAEASYSAALGRTRQQDIVRAQLELTSLDDRLTKLRQMQETILENLFEWTSGYFLEQYQTATPSVSSPVGAGLQLPRKLPDIAMLNKSLYTADRETDPQALYVNFADHPAVLAVEQKIKASELGIELARQSYKPMWGINAGYSYRDDAPSGDRADFLSVGLKFDLPIFPKNRQDKEVLAAVSQAEAVKTTKWSLVRKMIAGFEKNRVQLKRLQERQTLYQVQLLPQMHEQAEASLTAYTNDDGDFAEVVRARIAELNAQIEALEINVEKQKTIIDLNYYFMETAEDIIAGT